MKVAQTEPATISVPAVDSSVRDCRFEPEAITAPPKRIS